MSAELRIVGLQTDLHWRNPDANFAHFDTLLAAIPDGSCDVVVLPEMFTTGFSWPPIIPTDGPDSEIDWMQDWADRLGAAIAGSIACFDREDQPRNRFWFIPPSGEGAPSFYDKRHLFTLAGEHDHFTAGDNRVELEFRGFRILLQVCYDLRFPVFVRNDRHTPYDLALYVANWPETRSAAWRTLLQARAIENQCFVVGINRSGTDGNGHRYAGDSLIADFAGTLLAHAGGDGQPANLQATLNWDDMMAFRRKLPFLEDADARQG